MKSVLATLTLMGLVICSISAQEIWKPKPKAADAIRALLVTGGHDHDLDFYSVFDDPGIKTVVDPHPVAYDRDLRKRADVLVLYDMVKTLSEKQRATLRAYVESGKGVVLLHHAICANVDWPWWYEEVAGGRYLFEPLNGKVSSYYHDEPQQITTALEHPITKGLGTFGILDETYKDMWISPKAKVLLRTDNPKSDGPVAWISPYEKARVVYIQLGHDRNANLHPKYQQLVRNAIRWASGRQP
jgi:type 1 glutamine amidotransferase